MRKDETTVNLGDRAADNLRFIRETMERSTSFTAVPGFGGMLMGVTALAAAYIAASQEHTTNWLVTWLVEAGLAFVIGLFAMWQKSKIAGISLLSAPAMKFASGFVPPVLIGAVVTLEFVRKELFALMIPVWLLCYGAAVVCGGAFSVRIIPIMGWCFMVLGALAFLVPAAYGNWLMAAGFGVMHVIFGAVIAKKYGG